MDQVPGTLVHLRFGVRGYDHLDAWFNDFYEPHPLIVNHPSSIRRL